MKANYCSGEIWEGYDEFGMRSGERKKRVSGETSRAISLQLAVLSLLATLSN
jgi:hypothetical protein